MSTEQFAISGKSFGVENPGPAVDEAGLKRLEATIGTPLPAELRSYYARWNGGLPFPLDLPEDNAMMVRVFWPVGAAAARVGPIVAVSGMLRIDGEFNDFVENWQAFEGRYPKDLLCFQRDPGGSLFLVGIAEHNLGKIYYWARRWEANRSEGEVAGYDNIAYVAPSFLDFLLALRPEQGQDESDEDWIRRHYGDS